MSKTEAVKKTAPVSSTRKPKRAAADGFFARNTSAQRGPAPKRISPFPDPLFEATADPTSFQDALIYHTRTDVGWIRQHPELLKNVGPIDGLIAPEEIEFATRDGNGACDAFHRHAANRSKEIQRVARVHRDPFEPIMCVLEANSPLAEYRKITDEILKRMPDENRYPRPAAEAV